MAKVKTTERHYKNWKKAKVGLYIAQWSMPFIPATVITAVNWNDWFANQGLSLPFGFVSLLVSVLLSILAIYKRDDDAEKKISPIYSVAMILAVWGSTFLLLANIMDQMGFMFLATAGGVVGSATASQVNKSKIQPRIDEYRKLLDENVLDKKAQAKEQREIQAKEEAKQVVRVKIKGSE